MPNPAPAHPKIGDDFLLGINYWPRKKGMYGWERFDRDEVDEGFGMIADLGLKIVRFFLLWESFQPTPETVDARKLEHLRTVCDVASRNGLKVQPTFFTGHMSGPNWAPDWLVNWTSPKTHSRQLVSTRRHFDAGHDIHNLYTTPWVVEAEERKIDAVCRAVGDHDAIWGWSLGNEPDLFCTPPDSATGKAWIDRMIRRIKTADPRASEHFGLIGYHVDSLMLPDGQGLRVDHAAAVTDVSVMHGYSIFTPLARHFLDPDFVPFTCALAATLANRPILYEEYGICTHIPDAESKVIDMPRWDGSTRRQFVASEKDGGEYHAKVLERLQRVGAIGAFPWCFPSYDPSLWDVPQCDLSIHERGFGLWRYDGSLKPMGEAVKRFAAGNPKVLPPEKTVTLPVSPDEYYKNPDAYLPSMYEAFGTL